MSSDKNIVFVGVGGQGVVLASNVLAQVCLNADQDVKKAEVHGMSQRGGSVSSHLRYGEKIYSPLISLGEADIVVSFEWMEALRYLEFLKPGGIVVTSTQKIVPVSVTFGMGDYPTNVESRIAERGFELISVEAFEIARALGNTKVVSAVMLGALANCLGLTEKQWLDAIAQSVPPKSLALNERAFEAGRKCLTASVR